MRSKKKLILSVIRGNRGLTVGLALLFLVMFIMIVSVTLLPDSTSDSVDCFMRDYAVPDAWVITDLSYAPQPDIPGIRASESGLMTDMPVRLPGEPQRIRSLRLFSVEPDGFRQFYTLSEVEERPDAVGIRISGYFAEHNGLSAGDELEIMTPSGFQQVYIQATVSLPESMVCVRDQTSWRDASDFGYIYLQRQDMDRLFHTDGLSNYHSLQFDDGTEEAKKQEILTSFTEQLGVPVLSTELFEDSGVQSALQDLIKTLRTICSCFPFLVFLMGVFFTAVFMRQIVAGQRKNIGLLRALGCSVHQIVTIFIGYVLILAAITLLPGIGIGFLTFRMLSDIFRELYMLPVIVTVWHWGKLIAGFLIVIAAGLLSCLFCSRSVAGIDPCEAYGDPPVSDSHPIAFRPRSGTGICLKMALTFTLRNRFRFFQSAVSIAACIILMTVSLLYCRSQAAAVPTTFGNRFRYDCLVCTENAEEALSAVCDLPGVKDAEPVTIFFDTLCFEGKSSSVQIHALGAETELIVPSDRNGRPLSPDDGIILDEWTARELGAKTGDTVFLGETAIRVTGIARELVNIVQYISVGTAEKPGADVPQYLAIRFDGSVSGEDVCTSLTALPGYAYTVVPEHQHADYLQMLRFINLIVYILVGIAVFLGIIILYNMVVSNLNERRYEYATLQALGLQDRRFLGIAAIENLMLYISAVIPALPLSLIVAKYVLSAVSSDSQYLPVMFVGSTFAFSAGISLLFIIVGILFSFRAVKRIDPALALNARE